MDMFFLHSFRVRAAGVARWCVCAVAGLSVCAQVVAVQAISTEEYTTQRDEIRSEIATIQGALDFLVEDYHAIPEDGTLQDRIDELNDDLEKAEIATAQAQRVIDDLNQEMRRNEQQITTIEENMKGMLRSIQQQQASSPLEFIITSQDLGQLLSRINQYNELAERSEQLKQDMLAKNEELVRNRVLQEGVVKQAEDAEFVIASRQDTLRDLIGETGGSEVKFQELMARMRSERQAQLDELARLDQQWLSQNQGQVGSRGGGPCRFSEGRALDVGRDFFVAPTTGRRSRGVLCNYHDGIDIANASGTPIVSTADGVVVQTVRGWGGGFGNHVIVRHVTPGGIRFYSLYAHLRNDGILVSMGDIVQKGQHIGKMGTTGNSTGNHLHFMMLSDSYERTGPGCAYGSSRCYNPDVYINW